DHHDRAEIDLAGNAIKRIDLRVPHAKTLAPPGQPVLDVVDMPDEVRPQQASNQPANDTDRGAEGHEYLGHAPRSRTHALDDADIPRFLIDDHVQHATDQDGRHQADDPKENRDQNPLFFHRLNEIPLLLLPGLYLHAVKQLGVVFAADVLLPDCVPD